jgi:hypothetical protein
MFYEVEGPLTAWFVLQKEGGLGLSSGWHGGLYAHLVLV